MPVIQLALALAQFAPSIMRFFGAGEKPTAVAEKVVEIASGVAGSKDPAEIVERLRANAEMAQRFQMAVLDADLELERMYIEDRRSARERDVEVRRLTGGSNTRADLMIVGAVLGLVSCLVVLVLFRQEIPGEVVGIVSTVAGIFGACLRDAFQFEFGSSRGSKDKDELLARKLGG